MDFISPQYDELIAQAKLVKQSIPNETPEHIKWATLIEVVAQHIESEVTVDAQKESSLQQSLLGVYLYALESIYQEYYIHSPEYKNGYLYNSGSPLYSFLASILKLTATNKVTPKERLIFVNQFYKYLVDNASTLALQFTPLQIDQFEINIKKMLTAQLNALTNNIANIVNAIPTEKAITKHMDTLPDDYKEAKSRANQNSWFFSKKENKSRMLLAQLSKAIASIKCADEDNLPANTMSRSQRIKTGMLLYIINSINDEYYYWSYVRDPMNSELYKESKKILNNAGVENLDDTQKRACLSACFIYLSSNDTSNYLEEYGATHFSESNLLINIDSTLAPIREKLSNLEKSLEYSIVKDWPATTAFAMLGMILCASPGYGAGYVLGMTNSETQSAIPAKILAGQAYTGMASAFFGCTSAGYLAFMVGDFIVASALSRAFAKVFELVGMTIGGTVGGVIGFTFDLSYKGLRELCIRFLKVCDDNPVMMKNADRELINCLLELPPDLFAADKQNQILYIKGEEQTSAPVLK